MNLLPAGIFTKEPAEPAGFSVFYGLEQASGPEQVAAAV